MGKEKAKFVVAPLLVSSRILVGIGQEAKWQVDGGPPAVVGSDSFAEKAK